MSSTRVHRRAPQSSSGPRQPERLMAGASLLERRRQFHTKPQSDQRKRNAQKLSKRTPPLSHFNNRFCLAGAKCINFVCTIFSVHSVNPGRAWYPFLFIASESVHVVSLQAQKTPGQSTPAKMAVATKTTTPGNCRITNNPYSILI